MIPAQKTVPLKIRTLIISISTVFCIIITRLIFLQVYHVHFFTKKSHNNFTRYEYLSSLRGSIRDRFGNILVTNTPVHNIYWKGSGNKKLTNPQEQLIQKLCTLFDYEYETLKKKILPIERTSKEGSIIEKLTREQLTLVAELFAENNFLCVKSDNKRFYPYKSLASHLLGYIGAIDDTPIGKMGIERICNKTLTGKAGSLLHVINSQGMQLKNYHTQFIQNGTDITTTLDLSLQKIAERIFPLDQKGALILMDPYDGSIRVALSRPTFDPNLFTQQINHDIWKEVKEKKPFLNRINQAQYPPGSIFKLVTLAAALEQELISPYTVCDCKGYSMLAKRKYRCARRNGHGPITVTESVAYSCNILFYELAKQLDIDTIARYAHIFGLGQQTNSLFFENKGLVPTRAWKQEYKKEQWWLGETLSAAIGQSFLLATPLQIARLIGSLETGYLTEIRFLEDSVPQYHPLAISYQTRSFLRDAMHAVATEGTARMFTKLSNFTVRAKTSTAQTSTLSKRKEGKEFLEHGWFACNFNYKDAAPLTLVVVTENTGNAKLPMLIAREFLKSFEDLMRIRTLKQRS